jgi:Na+/H+-dicarboxylate symporter
MSGERVAAARAFGDSKRVLVALALGIGLGLLIPRIVPSAGRSVADAIRPIGELWVNAIRMTVIPLVTALLVTGIASVADLKRVGSLGTRTVMVFVTVMAGSAVVSLVVGTLVFGAYPARLGRPPLPPGASEAAAQVAASGPVSLLEWFTALIPPNPVAAAASGNMVSLIVFVFLVALAAAKCPPETREQFVAFFRSLSDVMLRLVHWIVALAPVAVFALVLPLAVHSGATLVGAVGFYIAAVAIVAAVVVALMYPAARLAGGAALGNWSRAVLPAQLIGASCSSSIATLPAMVESADRAGVSQRVSGFVLPLAVSVFKPAAPVMWIVGALFIGRFYGIELGARELGIIALASVLLSFAAPGVPRGAFLLLTPLFDAIGLPAEGIGVLIAIDAIPDALATVVNVTGDVTAATIVERQSSADVDTQPAM